MQPADHPQSVEEHARTHFPTGRWVCYAGDELVADAETRDQVYHAASRRLRENGTRPRELRVFQAGVEMPQPTAEVS